MTATVAHECVKCGAQFYYSPDSHRCPGEWESIAEELPPIELTTWDEECVRKVMGPRP